MRVVLVAVALCMISSTAAADVVHAQPTEITVRVISKDAKFIGTSMGGMRIVLRDVQTGEILASGLTSGGTGDTQRSMHTDGGRRSRLAEESAAKFVTSIELSEPRLIEVEAFGPLAQPQAAHRVTSSQWVVPGRNISAGDGWVLELPGFVVDVLAPAAHVTLPLGTQRVQVRANIVMMCGCPVEPKGIWDADRYEVRAIVHHEGKPTQSLDLRYAGEKSQFAGAVPVAAPGVYDVLVYAYDPSNGNTGIDRTTFIVQDE